jgi:alpha-beta hydrolase superfamily lysophospholipase
VVPDPLVTEARSSAERTIPGLTPLLKRRLHAIFRVLTALSPALAARLAMRLFTRPRPRPVEPEDLAFLSSARNRWFTSAAGRVRIYEWPAEGYPADTPGVLIVHGWRSNTARLRKIIEALRARRLRVAAFDAPGHGHSPGRRLDLESYRGMIAAVAHDCGPIQAVVAHSFGALTAMSWLADGPQNAPLRAAALIGVPRGVAFLFDSFTTVMGLCPAVIERMRLLFRCRYGRDPDSYRTTEMAACVQLPVLLVHGGADELVPAAHSEEVAGSLQAGSLHLFPTLSHGEPLRDPRTVALVADFIADHLDSCRR